MFETRIPRNKASRHEPKRDRRHSEQQQDPVRNRDRVRANDARVRAARTRAGQPPARRPPPRGLDLTQPCRGAYDGRHDPPTLPTTRDAHKRTVSHRREQAVRQRAIMCAWRRARAGRERHTGPRTGRADRGLAGWDRAGSVRAGSAWRSGLRLDPPVLRAATRGSGLRDCRWDRARHAADRVRRDRVADDPARRVSGRSNFVPRGPGVVCGRRRPQRLPAGEHRLARDDADVRDADRDSQFCGRVLGIIVQKIPFSVFNVASYIYLFATVSGSLSIKLDFLADHPFASVVIVLGGVVLLVLLARIFWLRADKLREQVKNGGAILGQPRRFVIGVGLPSSEATLRASGSSRCSWPHTRSPSRSTRSSRSRPPTRSPTAFR